MAVVKSAPGEVAKFKACTTQAGLAAFLGTTRGYLRFMLYSSSSPSYRLFEIPKASGSSRTISVPPPPILRWQRRLLSVISALYLPKAAAHGFIESRSIRTNALRHLGCRVLLNVDIENFFQSIHFGRVRGVFRKPPFDFPESVAATLAQLCTYARALPQGAPTSPIIANLVCRRLDNDLTRLASKHRCTYTRFADDITFSTRQDTLPTAIVAGMNPYGRDVQLGRELAAVILKHQFSPNPIKSRVQLRSIRQEVTGLTINERPNVRRDYISDLRAILDGWRKHGKHAVQVRFDTIDAGRRTRLAAPPDVAAHIRGKIEFLRMVRGKGDLLHAKYSIQASKLPGYPLRAALLEGRAAEILDFLKECLWILVGRDVAGDVISQGTAFHLEGIGYVSARHVIHPPEPGVTSWRVIRAAPPHDEFDVTHCKLHSHPMLDLTLLRTNAKSHAALRRAQAPLFMGQEVVIVGFPNWHTIADDPLRAPTEIVQRKIVSTIPLASVHYPLLSGASGSPVLDGFGNVVGVVVNSKDHATLPNGVIEIDNIDKLTAQTWTAV